MFCEKCSEEVPSEKILKHFRDYHPDEKDLSIQCPSCNAVFKTAPTFQKHWYSVHHVSKRKVKSDVIVPACKKQCVDVDVGQSSGAIVSGTPPPHVDGVKLSVLSCNAPDSGDDSVNFSVSSHSALDSSVEPTVQPSVIDQEGEVLKVGKSDHVSERDVLVESSDEESPMEDSDLDASASDDEDKKDNEEDNAAGVLEDVQESLQRDSEAGKVILAMRGSTLESSSSTVSLERLSSVSGLLVSKFREHCTLAATVELISDSTTLVESALKVFSSEIANAFKEKNVTLSNVVNVDRLIALCKEKLFENLKTVNQQEKYFKEKINVVWPLRIPFGHEFKRVRRKGKSTMQTVKKADTFMYVPLKSLIAKLISHPDYLKCIQRNPPNLDPSILDSYMKAELCKSNKILQEHPDALRFVMYYDDLEVCSPLKSRSGKQKIGAFYLLVDNIPAKYRSKLSVICLVALANANFLKTKSYGIDEAVSHIVEDLKKFEEGVLINGKKVFGTLIAFTGDNLGVHTVGGFKEGFTALRFCRFCSATLDVVRVMTKEDVSLLRTKDEHDLQCSKVQTSRGKVEKLSTEYGVNRASILNSLQHYHVIDGMPPDSMHDLLEGCLPLAIKRLLKHILYDSKEKKFTLEWLNKVIRDFDLDGNEKTDRPSELKKEYIVSEDTALHQTATQVWLLGTILPLVIGPYVDLNDLHYKNFLDCLKICRIVFTRNVSQWMVCYLEDAIETYLSDVVTLYGQLIPKEHHLVHYPGLILKFGSMTNYNCLRFEAKHLFFKKLVNLINCYKDIPLTLSRRHQHKQANDWSKSLWEVNSCGPCKSVNITETPYAGILPFSSKNVIECNWLLLDGIKFSSVNNFICVEVLDCLPTFVKIVAIFILPDVCFVCQKVKTVRRSVHFAAYEIEVINQFCLQRPSDMIIHSVLHPHKVENASYIALKHCASDTIF